MQYKKQLPQPVKFYCCMKTVCLAVLEEKLPGIAAAFHDALEAVAPSESYAQKGFHGLLSAGVETLAESAVKERAAVQSAEARRQAAKKVAK